MGLDFLARVRRTTAWITPLAALMAATYASPRHGLAVVCGALWSLANLWLLERLVVALTSADRGTPPAARRAALALAGMVPLFAAGAALLLVLPPLALLAGFGVPFAALVLKAASTLLLGSRAWRALVASPFRAALIVLSLLVAAWWLAPQRIGAQPQHDPAPAAQAPADAHDPHAEATHGAGDAAATADAHGAAAHGGHAKSAGPEKFANVITILYRAFPDAGWAHFLHEFEAVLFALFVALLLCLVAFLATRNATMIPGRLQNVVEMLVGALYDFVAGILGEKDAKRFVPFLGTLFLYIWVMNLFGLIPFMDSPTSSLNVTVALALLVFLYSQWVGLRGLGPLGWIDHMAGSPRTPISWALVPLMLPIHLLGELAKPISLSCRLFGNVFGEDMLLVAFTTLGVTTLAFTGLPIGLPLQLPFLLLALLTGTLQALVFTVLSTIYLLLMLPHDDHGHEGEAQHAH
jgi:F-type H+-transporting ATPase subunit a